MSEPTAHPTVERIITFDVLRGIAIGMMVFLHNAAFHLATVAELLKSPPPWLTIFGFLLLWAGLFGVVSGAANATATLRRLGDEAQRQRGTWRYPPTLVAGALQTFLILFALHWIWTIVVGNSAVTTDPNDPTLRVTLVLGWIYYHFFPHIHPENWVFASALWMIGSNVLLVSLSLRWFYRSGPPRNDDGVQWYLLRLAIVVLGVTPILRGLLFGPMMSLVAQRGAAVIAAVPLALLINDPNPIFPFFAYGLFGAVAGVSLVRDEPRGPLYRLLGWSGAALLTIGGLGLGSLGGIIVAERENIWGQSPLYFTSLSYVLLGVFAWLLIGLLSRLDPERGSPRSPWRPAGLALVLRFGRVSLTIFLFEGIVAMLARVALDTILPNWNASLPAVFLFAMGNVWFWHVALRFWERVDFRYSVEWWVARLRRADDRARALRTRC